MRTLCTRNMLSVHCTAALAALTISFSPAAALDRSVVGKNGMVVAGHPLAVQAGLKVLQAGGTACDAAIATATVLSIAMTDMMGPAGSGYALLWEPQKKELSSIDYNGVAPAATDPKKFDMAKKLRGPMAPTVPGALKGWEAVHKKCGNRPWAELWTDAIGYAENGWPLDTESNFHIKRHIPEIGINESWAKEFLVNNDAPGPGYMLKRPDLAQSYKAFRRQGVGCALQRRSRRQAGGLHEEGRWADLQGRPHQISGQVEPADPDHLSRLHGLWRAAELVLHHLDADPQYPRGLRPEGDGAEFRRLSPSLHRGVEARLHGRLSL